MNPLYTDYKTTQYFKEYKVCGTCKEEKYYTDFYISKTRTKTKYLKLEHSCKECMRIRSRVNKYKSLYGISLEIFKQLFKDSEGECKICRTELTFPKYQLAKEPTTAHIDHCHKTKKVRGLLCHHCNVGLGSFKDSPELLERAKEYLNAS